MPITDALAIKEHTQLREGAAEKVAQFAALGEERLRVLVGDDSYDDISNDQDHDEFGRLQRAESYFAVYYGLQFLNLRPTDLGGLTKVVGYGDSATEMLMGERELRAIRSNIYQMAIDLLWDIRQGVPEDPEEFRKSGIQSYDAGSINIA